MSATLTPRILVLPNEGADEARGNTTKRERAHKRPSAEGTRRRERTGPCENDAPHGSSAGRRRERANTRNTAPGALQLNCPGFPGGSKP